MSHDKLNPLEIEVSEESVAWFPLVLLTVLLRQNDMDGFIVSASEVEAASVQFGIGISEVPDNPTLIKIRLIHQDAGIE